MESCSKRTTILPFCVATLEWKIPHFDLMVALGEPTLMQKFCSSTDTDVVWEVCINPKINSGEFSITIGHNLDTCIKANVAIWIPYKGTYSINVFSSVINVQEGSIDNNRIPVDYETIESCINANVEWKFVVAYFNPKKIPMELYSLTSEDNEMGNRFSFLVRNTSSSICVRNIP